MPGSMKTCRWPIWLPGSDYPPDASFDEATGAFSCEIVIPLAPLGS